MHKCFGWGGSNISYNLESFYLNHTTFVEAFSKKFRHKLVVVDISSSNAASVMQEAFNISRKCWENSNMNRKHKP